MMICYSKGENPNLSPWRQGWQSRNHKLPKPNITFPRMVMGLPRLRKCLLLAMTSNLCSYETVSRIFGPRLKGRGKRGRKRDLTK